MSACEAGFVLGVLLTASAAFTALDALSLTAKECGSDFCGQLSERIKPIHYKLNIEVNPEDPDFSGQVEIELKTHNPSTTSNDDVQCGDWWNWIMAPACNRRTISLNAHENLSITNVSYYDNEREIYIPVACLCRSAQQEMIVIELSSESGKSSSGKLALSFYGLLRNDFKGLFRADYHDTRANTDKLAALTQFSSGHARKMFPCFDEPEFKATFELSVEHPAHLTAIANTRPLRREDEPLFKKYTKTYFSTTPKMSTYLLAFAVGEFERIETYLPDANMTLGIYTPPGRSEEARFSLGLAAKAYVALQEFLNVSQPLDKIDFVSCKDFSFGAMENWGLITTEEFALLLNQSEGSTYKAVDTIYESIMIVIHELAHQWFGNLVTPKWWDNLWLKEGFASWISNELVDQLYFEHDFKLLYLLKDMREALAMDAQLGETHPIKNSKLNRTIAEIDKSFDEIAYKKAGAVIRMLSYHIGQAKFKESLRAYIRENQFGNTEDLDLAQAVSATSGIDTRQLIDTWITQAGFPLITVKLKDDAQSLKVSQRRFLPKTDSAGGKPGQIWLVPITLVISNGAGKEQKIRFVLGKKRDEIKLPGWFDLGKPGHWLKLNSDFQGFYRVHYETRALLQALRVPIETKSMSLVDRLNVLEDRLGLLKAGLISRRQFEDTLTWYKGEDHDAVIDLIAEALIHLEKDLDSDKEAGVCSILIDYYEKNDRLSGSGGANLTGNGASLVKKLARKDAIKQLVDANYNPALQDALELFAKTNGTVPAFLRAQVYGAVAKAGTDEQFTKVINLVSSISPKRVKLSTVGDIYWALRRESTKKRREEVVDKFSYLF